jgi:hypothetical protein
MTRILVIGTGAADVAAQLDALGLATISTARAFRELVELMPQVIGVPVLHTAPAPAFGGDRPYLKKKKGRS